MKIAKFKGRNLMSQEHDDKFRVKIITDGIGEVKAAARRVNLRLHATFTGYKQEM